MLTAPLNSRAVTVPDHVEVLADLANGAIARMHWSSVAGFMPGPEVWLYGAEGTLRLEQRGRDIAPSAQPVTPDQTGAFSGGSVQIKTKSFPDPLSL